MPGMKFYRLLCVALLAVRVSAQAPPPADALFAAIRHGAAGEVERALKTAPVRTPWTPTARPP